MVIVRTNKEQWEVFFSSKIGRSWACVRLIPKVVSGSIRGRCGADVEMSKKDVLSLMGRYGDETVDSK